MTGPWPMCRGPSNLIRSLVSLISIEGPSKSGGGIWTGALADYEKAIELTPNLSIAYSQRGFIKIIKGDLNGAMADQLKAIELDPRNDSAFCHRGIVKEKQGDLGGALADYNQSLAMNPSTNIRAYVSRGMLKTKQKDLGGALADLNKAIAIDPKISPGFLHRAAVKKRIRGSGRGRCRPESGNQPGSHESGGLQ